MTDSFGLAKVKKEGYVYWEDLDGTEHELLLADYIKEFGKLPDSGWTWLEMRVPRACLDELGDYITKYLEDRGIRDD